MASPVVPQDFLALLPNASNGVCNEMDKMTLQTPQTLLDLATYLFNEDGTVTTAFATDICSALVLIGCAGGTTSTTTAGTGTTTTTSTTTNASEPTTVWYVGARNEEFSESGNAEICAGVPTPTLWWYAGRGTFGTMSMTSGLRTEISDACPEPTVYTPPVPILHYRALAWNPSTSDLWCIYQFRRQDKVEGADVLSVLGKVNKATGQLTTANGTAMTLDAEYYAAVWNPAGTIMYAARGSTSGGAYANPAWAGNFSVGPDGNLASGTIVEINSDGTESNPVITTIEGATCRIYALEYGGSTLYCFGFGLSGTIEPFFGTVDPTNGAVTVIAYLTLSEGFIDWYYAGAPYGQLSTTVCLLYKNSVMHLLVMDGGCGYKNMYTINTTTGDLTFKFPVGSDGTWDPTLLDASIGTMPLYLEAGT